MISADISLGMGDIPDIFLHMGDIPYMFFGKH